MRRSSRNSVGMRILADGWIEKRPYGLLFDVDASTLRRVTLEFNSEASGDVFEEYIRELLGKAYQSGQSAHSASWQRSIIECFKP